MSDAPVAPMPQRRSTRAARLLPWVITIACFAFLYTRIDGAAQRQGSSLVPYLAQVFEKVDWWTLARADGSVLAALLPDRLAGDLARGELVQRAACRTATSCPMRASTYILSILNEQVGKGAMAYYLNRRDGVPGWQVGSSMLFVMFCEFYYLLALGVRRRDAALGSRSRRVPRVAVGGARRARVLRAVGALLPRRDRARLEAARSRHAALVPPARARGSTRPSSRCARRRCSRPSCVYSRALGLFGIESSFLEMLGYCR